MRIDVRCLVRRGLFTVGSGLTYVSKVVLTEGYSDGTFSKTAIEHDLVGRVQK